MPSVVKKKRGRPRINMATVIKKYNEGNGFNGLDEAKKKAQKIEEWKNQTLKNYLTRNSRINTK